MYKLSRISGVILLLLSIFMTPSCEKEELTIPTINTTNATEISNISASSGGEVTDNGGSPIVSRGVCWHTSMNPTIENNKTTETGVLDSFISKITQLIPNTKYFVRAYAINSIGIAYGNEIHFTTNSILVTGISLDLSSAGVTSGSSKQLITTLYPENATNQNINWSSSNSSVATVNNGLVSGVTVGSVTITATTEDGSFIANCQINVNPIKVASLILNANLGSMIKNETFQLIVTVSPTNAENTNVTWSSTNPDVANVSNSGFVTAIAIGSAEITVTSLDGSNITTKFIANVVPITGKISLAFSSTVNINGWIIGNTYSFITNNSYSAITLTKFEIIDSGTNTVIISSTDVNQLGILAPGTSTNLGANINLYKPIFKWYFTFDGNSFTVQHQTNP